MRIIDTEFSASCSRDMDPKNNLALKIQGSIGADEINVLNLLKNCHSPYIVRIYIIEHFLINQESLRRLKAPFKELGNFFNHPDNTSIKVIGIGMEAVDGTNLRSLKGTISDKKLFKFILQIASGLEWLHSKNIVHRDIKPSNLVLDAKLTAVKIKIDFFHNFRLK